MARGPARIPGIVVDALADEDDIGDAEVAGEGDRSRGEVGEEGAWSVGRVSGVPRKAVGKLGERGSQGFGALFWNRIS